MTTTIYHNPACGTSRNVLALIRNSGEEPEIVEYLRTPPAREVLAGLIRRMGIPVRDVLRQKGTPYEALGLGDLSLTDDQLRGLFREYAPDMAAFLEKGHQPAESVICTGKIRHTGKSSYMEQFEYMKTLVPREEWPNIKLTLAAPNWYGKRTRSGGRTEMLTGRPGTTSATSRAKPIRPTSTRTMKNTLRISPLRTAPN